MKWNDLLKIFVFLVSNLILFYGSAVLAVKLCGVDIGITFSIFMCMCICLLELIVFIYLANTKFKW